MDEKVLKALGEPKRFLLLTLVAERGYCVGALARKSALSESAVSQHLKILREAGLVEGIKRGYYTHYFPSREGIDALIQALTAIRDAGRCPCSQRQKTCSEAAALGCDAVTNGKKEDKPC